MKTLIVHSRRTGVGLIRSLGSNGVEVYTADVFKAPGFYSKYVKKGFILSPIINKGEKNLLVELLRIGEEISQGEKIYLFTASDDYLLLFTKYWNRLSKYFIATFETNLVRMQNSLEKGKMYKIAQKARVPFPLSFYSPVDALNIRRYPVVIKPTLKKTSTIDVVKEAFRIKFCADEKELRSAITQLEDIDVAYVVQEYIEGGDDQLYTAGIFAYKGDLIAGATGRKLRQFPPVTGECSFGELVDEPLILEYAKRYVETSGITGMCQVEFKKFKKEFYLMEINPRPWSWNSLMDFAGVNLPLIACQTIEGVGPSKYYEQKIFNGTWVFSYMDFRYNVLKNKNISFLTWMKNSFNASKHAFWNFNDPLPAIVAIYQSLKYG